MWGEREREGNKEIRKERERERKRDVRVCVCVCVSCCCGVVLPEVCRIQLWPSSRCLASTIDPHVPIHMKTTGARFHQVPDVEWNWFKGSPQTVHDAVHAALVYLLHVLGSVLVAGAVFELSS